MTNLCRFIVGWFSESVKKCAASCRATRGPSFFWRRVSHIRNAEIHEGYLCDLSSRHVFRWWRIGFGSWSESRIEIWWTSISDLVDNNYAFLENRFSSKQRVRKKDAMHISRWRISSYAVCIGRRHFLDMSTLFSEKYTIFRPVWSPSSTAYTRVQLRVYLVHSYRHFLLSFMGTIISLLGLQGSSFRIYFVDFSECLPIGDRLTAYLY